MSKHKASGKFEGYIMRNAKKFYLGLFDSPEEALAARKGAQKAFAAA